MSQALDHDAPGVASAAPGVVAPGEASAVLALSPRTEAPFCDARNCGSPCRRLWMASASRCVLDIAEENPHGMTLAAVAEHFDCTRERIRQIEAKALSKLNRRAPAYGLDVGAFARAEGSTITDVGAESRPARLRRLQRAREQNHRGGTSRTHRHDTGDTAEE